MRNLTEMSELFSKLTMIDAAFYAGLAAPDRDEMAKALLHEAYFQTDQTVSDDWPRLSRAMNQVFTAGVVLTGHEGWRRDEDGFAILDRDGVWHPFQDLREGELSGVLDGVLLDIVEMPSRMGGSVQEDSGPEEMIAAMCGFLSMLMEKIGTAAMEVETERARCALYAALPEELHHKMAASIDLQVVGPVSPKA